MICICWHSFCFLKKTANGNIETNSKKLMLDLQLTCEPSSTLNMLVVALSFYFGHTSSCYITVLSFSMVTWTRKRETWSWGSSALVPVESLLPLTCWYVQLKCITLTHNGTGTMSRSIMVIWDQTLMLSRTPVAEHHAGLLESLLWAVQGSLSFHLQCW